MFNFCSLFSVSECLSYFSLYIFVHFFKSYVQYFYHKFNSIISILIGRNIDFYKKWFLADFSFSCQKSLTLEANYNESWESVHNSYLHFCSFWSLVQNFYLKLPPPLNAWHHSKFKNTVIYKQSRTVYSPFVCLFYNSTGCLIYEETWLTDIQSYEELWGWH